jgi:hypothetical protein
MSSLVDAAAVATVATKDGRLFGADFVTKECVAVNVDDRSSKDRENFILNLGALCLGE